jgi:AraC-like DNA-binding protein
MRETLRGVQLDRLERSCAGGADSIRFGARAAGIERAEVHLRACSFEPHRHDTYAIGVTTAGIQTFNYRGERRIGLPAQLHILHPDETHDGAAGSDSGFAYRILYISPELICSALDDGELPFVTEPVHDVSPKTLELAALAHDVDAPISDLGRVEIAATVADTLRALAGRIRRRGGPVDARTAHLVRDYLLAHTGEQTPAWKLEQVAGTDRFTIARHFRRTFGTSPDRYRTMRRLALVRATIEHGQPLAAAAFDAGFADQSHMTRQFKRAYGMTPGRWQAITAAAREPGRADHQPSF